HRPRLPQDRRPPATHRPRGAGRWRRPRRPHVAPRRLPPLRHRHHLRRSPRRAPRRPRHLGPRPHLAPLGHRVRPAHPPALPPPCGLLCSSAPAPRRPPPPPPPPSPLPASSPAPAPPPPRSLGPPPPPTSSPP